MGKFVGICVGLFVLAAGFVGLTQGSELAALAQAFSSQTLLHQAAWAVVVVVPLAMVILAVWQWNRLLRHRQTARKLEQRLDGVRDGVTELRKSQGEAEADLQHLALTDPEDAISALKRRLAEAERFAEVQRRRNEEGALESRIDDVRAQQQGLRERLAPVLDVRRSLEQVFGELDSQQNDIDRVLAEIASGDDALAIDVRLKSLSDFVRRSHARCDQIELASKTVATLDSACADLAARLAPLAAPEGGIRQRLEALAATSDDLAVQVDSLASTPQGPLADRLQKLTEGKTKLDDGISRLSAQFFELGGLRRDTAALSEALDRSLDALASADDGAGSGAGLAGANSRAEELKRFVEQTQGKFDEIEKSLVAFGQLRSRLGDLQSRLAPLESEETGVAKLLDEVRQVRDLLTARIRRVEGGGQGDLEARIKLFADSEKDLEARVSSLADQVAKLSTIRNDIAGLFDKLSTAVNGSSN